MEMEKLDINGLRLELLLITQKIERNQLEDGDHIYTWRAGFTYSHHGIYIGEGKVVHFTHQGTAEPPPFNWSWSNLSSFLVSSQRSTRLCCQANCGIPKKPESGVVLSCLDCFLCGGKLHRYKYGVSQSVLLATLRGGTCTMASQDPPEDVIHRAMHLLETGFGKYDLVENNCEDFALYCKTGLLSTSKEAKGLGSQAHFLRTPPEARRDQTDSDSTTKGIFEMINEKRLYYDLGNRQDVVKVPVEEVNSIKQCNPRRTILNFYNM